MVRPGGVTPGLRRQDVGRPEPRSFVTGVPLFLGFVRGAAALLGTVRLSASADLAALLARAAEFNAATSGNAATSDGTVRESAGAGIEPAGAAGERARIVGEIAGSALVDAVRGFFANGGGPCYVAWADEGLAAGGPAGSPGGGTAAGTAAGVVRRRLAELADLDEVDLICLPDVAYWEPETAFAAQRAALEHCAARGDRFAVLDAVQGADARTLRRQVAALTGRDGAFGALYHPWVRVPAPGAIRHVPPCGHLAGTYAAADRERGVHRAPANREIEGVLDVAVDLADDELDRLYELGVNPVRALPGRGVRAWGARTLGEAPEWRAITVRRLVSTIGRWAQRFLATSVHEPNDVRLWVRIMRELTAALGTLHLAGAFAGRTAEESFYVKCDHETNPPDVVAAGMVVTEIGVAAAVPAEFIVVRVVQGADEGLSSDRPAAAVDAA